MKRLNLMRLLEQDGLQFREGGNHTKAYRNGGYVTAIPRHKVIPELMARKILREAGVDYGE